MGVVADMPSTHNLLIKLEQFGHKFLAHFHSHPGNGPDATHPSGTDENFQRRLESAGHLALMAIFSRDGYVRFIRLDQNFEIEIYGEGVETMRPAFTGSRTSISLRGTAIPGAWIASARFLDSIKKPSRRPRTLHRGGRDHFADRAHPGAKGHRRITLLDDDFVEPTNLNRQRFYIKDVGKTKRSRSRGTLQPECIVATEIRGYPFRLEEAIASGWISLAMSRSAASITIRPALPRAATSARKTFP